MAKPEAVHIPTDAVERSVLVKSLVELFKNTIGEMNPEARKKLEDEAVATLKLYSADEALVNEVLAGAEVAMGRYNPNPSGS